ncbi:4-oxalocrotonate tautomerase family protein [Thermodesulfobacteriota bacterium]
MPQVTVKCIEGRTIDQKRGLVKDITEAFIKHFNIGGENLVIEIIELSRENLSRAGQLFIDRKPPQ